MDDDVTLLYGLGATKAGTTWLRQYLSGHPEVFIRSQFELHYFSSLAEDNSGWRIKALNKKIRKLRRRRDNAPESDVAAIKEQISTVKNWRRVANGEKSGHTNYLSFLNDGRENEKVVADITPAYGFLGRRDLHEMRVLHGKTRFIFVMRDPLERVWSNIRMAAKRKTRKDGGTVEEHARNLLADYVDGKNPIIDKRSNYSGTIQQLMDAVPRKNILFVFFEWFFRQETLNQITDFLRIAPHRAELGERVHQGVSIKKDDTLMEKALERLAPQYAFISEFFAGQIPDSWHTPASQLPMVEV